MKAVLDAMLGDYLTGHWPIVAGHNSALILALGTAAVYVVDLHRSVRLICGIPFSEVEAIFLDTNSHTAAVKTATSLYFFRSPHRLEIIRAVQTALAAFNFVRGEAASLKLFLFRGETRNSSLDIRLVPFAAYVDAEKGYHLRLPRGFRGCAGGPWQWDGGEVQIFFRLAQPNDTLLASLEERAQHLFQTHALRPFIIDFSESFSRRRCTTADGSFWSCWLIAAEFQAGLLQRRMALPPLGDNVDEIFVLAKWQQGVWDLASFLSLAGVDYDPAGLSSPALMGLRVEVATDVAERVMLSVGMGRLAEVASPVIIAIQTLAERLNLQPFSAFFAHLADVAEAPPSEGLQLGELFSGSKPGQSTAHKEALSLAAELLLLPLHNNSSFLEAALGALSRGAVNATLRTELTAVVDALVACNLGGARLRAALLKSDFFSHKQLIAVAKGLLRDPGSPMEAVAALQAFHRGLRAADPFAVLPQLVAEDGELIRLAASLIDAQVPLDVLLWALIFLRDAVDKASSIVLSLLYECDLSARLLRCFTRDAASVEVLAYAAKLFRSVALSGQKIYELPLSLYPILCDHAALPGFADALTVALEALAVDPHVEKCTTRALRTVLGAPPDAASLRFLLHSLKSCPAAFAAIEREKVETFVGSCVDKLAAESPRQRSSFAAALQKLAKSSHFAPLFAIKSVQKKLEKAFSDFSGGEGNLRAVFHTLRESAHQP